MMSPGFDLCSNISSLPNPRSSDVTRTVRNIPLILSLSLSPPLFTQSFTGHAIVRVSSETITNFSF
jgi:hypothetical protein